MRTLSIGLGVLGAVMFAGAALANGEPSVTQGDPNEIVCKNVKQRGSHLGEHKVCATRAEWESRRQYDQDRLVEAQRAALRATQH